MHREKRWTQMSTTEQNPPWLTLVAQPEVPDPQLCQTCNGAGTVEACSYAVGLHDVRCDDCDGDGFVR